MTRHLLVLIVSTLILVSCAAKAEETTSTTASQQTLNQVYVKVIMPAGANRDKDRPVVESWIAEDLKKLGLAKFTAVTGWVPLDLSPLESTDIWDGGQLGKQYYCPVDADIERAQTPVIKVHVSGWSPGGGYVIVSLRDEPGSRVIAAVKELKTQQGMPYVAAFIGPPVQEPAAPTDRKR